MVNRSVSPSRTSLGGSLTSRGRSRPTGVRSGRSFLCPQSAVRGERRRGVTPLATATLRSKMAVRGQIWRAATGLLGRVSVSRQAATGPERHRGDGFPTARALLEAIPAGSDHVKSSTPRRPDRRRGRVRGRGRGPSGALRHGRSGRASTRTRGASRRARVPEDPGQRCGDRRPVRASQCSG